MKTKKLAKNTYPERSGPDDFQCFGPPATKDGDFETVKIADMGCFTQDGKDSNKYYHAAVVQHKKSKKWYAYFEWGRTGATHPNFQFVACDSEAEAQAEFAGQLHSKNDHRGEWATVAGLRTLRARKGKDCYLVRPMATRCTGLPDARSIHFDDGVKSKRAVVKASKTGGKVKSVRKKAGPNIDEPTKLLLRDLAIATVAYTRGAMADASLPTQTAIDEARSFLAEAEKRLLKVGDEVKKQVKDKELLELTSLMYGRIPKKKPLRAAPAQWILNKDNIFAWRHDLDAFESALHISDTGADEDEEVNPLEEMQLTMEYLPEDSELGGFLYEWWPQATANKHGGVGKMKILNLWRVERHLDAGKLSKAHKDILKDEPDIDERPLHQPRKRPDVSGTDAKRYLSTNTSMLFHGTRSVNVRGILRESLRLPKQLVGVAITGAMFGPGLYFADDWKKSAGYTSLHGSYWSAGNGGVKGRQAFMFLTDVVLGKPFVAPHAQGYTAPPRGHHSIFGKAGASGVVNNEFIVFDAKQHQLRYLIEFTTK